MTWLTNEFTFFPFITWDLGSFTVSYKQTMVTIDHIFFSKFVSSENKNKKYCWGKTRIDVLWKEQTTVGHLFFFAFLFFIYYIRFFFLWVLYKENMFTAAHIFFAKFVNSENKTKILFRKIKNWCQCFMQKTNYRGGILFFFDKTLCIV